MSDQSDLVHLAGEIGKLTTAVDGVQAEQERQRKAVESFPPMVERAVEKATAHCAKRLDCHLAAHGLDPETQTYAETGEGLNRNVATERVQLRRRWGRVVSLSFGLGIALVGLVSPAAAAKIKGALLWLVK